MYVSAINSLSCNAQVRKSNLVSNTNASKSQPIFKAKKNVFDPYALVSYKDAFIEAFTSFPKTRKELDSLYKTLTNTSVKGKSVQPRKGNQKMFLNVYTTIEEALESVSKEQNSALVLKDGQERVTKNGKKLEFKGEQGDYVTFELGSNQQLTFSQNHEDGGDFFKFFKYGNLESHKNVTGSGVAQSSKTTYYNDDGSTNTFKTFFCRLFGI